MNTTVDFQPLLNSLPEGVWKVLEIFWQNNVSTILVGGATRDFVFSTKYTKDLDFEIQAGQSILEHEWPDILRRISTELKTKIKIAVMNRPFSIMTTNIDGFDLEFAPVRIEYFQDFSGSRGHSDFDVELPPRLDWHKAFARRDFTINAIGLHVESPNNWKIIDPYEGIQDLKKRQLRSCGRDFTKDPVRFLRAIRFRQLIAGSFDPELESQMQNFDLRKLTLHYFKYESFKYNFWQYCHAFFTAIDKYHLQRPEWVNSLSFLVGKEHYQHVFNEVDALAILVLQQSGSEVGNLDRFCDIFQIRLKILQELSQLKMQLNTGYLIPGDFQVENFQDWQQAPARQAIQSLVKHWGKIINGNYHQDVLESWRKRYPILLWVDKVVIAMENLKSTSIPAKIPSAERASYRLYLVITGKHE